MSDQILRYTGLILVGFILSIMPGIVSQAQDSPHRIGVRVVDGIGEFYDTVTDEKFVPRGVNYLDFRPVSFGLQDRVLATNEYDPEKIRTHFQRLADAGYNTVRIFFDLCMVGDECITNFDEPGVNPDYIANMADIMHIAAETGIYIQFTSNDIPDGGGYGDLANRDANEQIEGYRNAHYLTEGGAQAFANYWHDILTLLNEMDAPTEALLGWQLVNEQWFFKLQPPFSLTSGMVQTATGEYDMADADSRRDMAVDGVLNYIESATAVIRELDPNTLITIGYFAPQYPNATGIGGDWYVETAPLIERAPVDYFDFHAYTDMDLGVVEQAENFGMIADQRKPVVMGEVTGGKSTSLSAASQLALELQWMAASCEVGFDGWLHWGYFRNPEAIGGDFWTFLDEDGLLFDGLAPINHPDPCVVPDVLPSSNVAFGAQVQASNQLPEEPATYAVDGRELHFCSGGDAPQWLDVNLNTPTTVSRVAASLAQWPSGNSRHQFIARLQDGTEITLAEFSGYHQDGDVFIHELSVPLPDVVAVRLLTPESAAWPCWHEVEIVNQTNSEATACLVIARNTVNLRTEPTTRSEQAGSLLAGTGSIVSGEAIGEDDGLVWWQLTTGEWVRSDVVTNRGDCESPS